MSKKTEQPKVDANGVVVGFVPATAPISDSSTGRAKRSATAQYLPEQNNDELQQEYLLIYGDSKGSHLDATFHWCFKYNVPYIGGIIGNLVKSKGHELDFAMPKLYLDELQQHDEYNDLTFFKQLRRENFDVVYQEDLALLNFDEEAETNRLAILECLGYKETAQKTRCFSLGMNAH